MKSIIIILMLSSYCCCFGQETIVENVLAKTMSDSLNQTIILPTEPMGNGYVLGFYPYSYREPVSMFPLAVVMVFGTILIIGLLACLYEYITEKK